jgi:hypothetical protein
MVEKKRSRYVPHLGASQFEDSVLEPQDALELPERETLQVVIAATISGDRALTSLARSLVCSSPGG